MSEKPTNPEKQEEAIPSDSSAKAEDDFTLLDLTDAIKQARSGFRKDVARLVDQLSQGGLYVALAEAVEAMETGKDLAPESDVTLKPHLLPDRDGTFFVPLFTDPDILKSVGDYVEWTTGGEDSEELQFCTLPASAALDLALQLIDGTTVVGAVINPSDEFELMLHRHEVGALSQGQAVPLVGYVEQIPVGDDEEVLIAELEMPPSQELLDAIDECVKAVGGITGYKLQQSFNAERDLEPHPTLVLTVGDPEAINHEVLNETLSRTLEGKLPEPGYIDVLFDTEGTKAD